MSAELTIKCRKLVPGKGEGEALAAAATLSFWGEVDPMSGRIIAAGHPLEGQTLRGKVLVIKSTKGSSATSLVMGLAHQQGNAPVAIVNTEIDCLGVLGCVVNEIPMVADLEQDPFQVIETGDQLIVDADQGFVRITKKAGL
jgi:predicted aconitase with swiveling domain